MSFNIHNLIKASALSADTKELQAALVYLNDVEKLTPLLIDLVEKTTPTTVEIEAAMKVVLTNKIIDKYAKSYCDTLIKDDNIDACLATTVKDAFIIFKDVEDVAEIVSTIAAIA